VSVEPFPIKRCLHYLEMVRANIEAQPASKRRAFLWKIVEQHRQFLKSIGVDPDLIKREVRDLALIAVMAARLAVQNRAHTYR
jgi:hypothetical protein